MRRVQRTAGDFFPYEGVTLLPLLPFLHQVCGLADVLQPADLEILMNTAGVEFPAMEEDTVPYAALPPALSFCCTGPQLHDIEDFSFKASGITFGPF